MKNLFLIVIGFVLLIISNNCLLGQIKQIDSLDSIISSTINTIEKESTSKEAIAILQELIKKTAHSPAHDTSKHILYHKLGVSYYKLGELEQAIRYIDTALTYQSNQLLSFKKISNSYYARANFYAGTKIIERALADIKIAMDYQKRLPKAGRTELPKYLNLAIKWTIELGDLGQAKNYIDYALKNRTEIYQPISSSLAALYTEISSFYAQKYQPDKSLIYDEKALNIYESIEDINNIIASSNNIATYSSSIKEYDKALRGYRLAVESINYLLSESSNDIDIIKKRNSYINNISNTLLLIKKNKAAKREYQRLLQFAEMEQSNDSYISAYEGLADIARAAKDYTSALHNYQKAIQYTSVDYTNNNVYSNPSIKKDVVLYKSDLQRLLFLKAKSLQEKYKESQQLKDLEGSMNTYKTLDSLLVNIRQGYQSTTSKYYQLRENIPIYDKVVQVALQLYELTGNKKYQNEAFYLGTKNKTIVLLEDLKDKKAKFAGIPPELLTEEQALKKAGYDIEVQIAEWEQTKQDSLLQHAYNERIEISVEYERLIKTLETQFPAYYQLKYAADIPVNPTDLKEKLPSETLLIEYFVTDSTIFIYTISEEGLEVYQKRKPNDFESLCGALRMESTNKQAIWKTYTTAAYRMYQLLLEEVLENNKKAKRLLLVPDDYLLQINFESLLDSPILSSQSEFSWSNSKEIPFLLHKYAISYAYSNQLLFNDSTKEKEQQVLKQLACFALEYDEPALNKLKASAILKIDSTRGATLGPLKYAIAEIDELLQFIKGDRWTNAEATKAVFERVSSYYQFIHLSMHGIIEEDQPLNSALVFSSRDTNDYLLRVADLFNMSLNAEMVVLSACNTGDGVLQKGDGIRTLARAFHYAGVPSLVASLWSAEDKSTKEIIVSFYRFLQQGLPKDEAMRQAKLSYLNQANNNPDAFKPTSWSHLIVLGDTRPVSLKSPSFLPKIIPVFFLGFGICLFLFFWRKNRHKVR